MNSVKMAANIRGSVNISDRQISDSEKSLLLRGLKFCPTPNMPDPGLLQCDLDALHRRLRLINNFKFDNDDETTTTPNTVPVDNDNLPGPSNLEAYIASNLVNYNNRPVYRRPNKQNLSPEETKAIRALSGDKSIVIKPADKGAAVVIMNRLEYLKEGYRQLSDS